MTAEQQALLTATPADREVYLAVVMPNPVDNLDRWTVAKIRDGVDDHQPPMQAIIRHRLDATRPQSTNEGAEAVGEVVLFGVDLKEIAWPKGKLPPVGTKLYAHPQAVLPEGELKDAVARLARKADPAFGLSTICDRADLALVLAALSNISTSPPVESSPLWAGYDPAQTGCSDGGPVDPASAGGEA